MIKKTSLFRSSPSDSSQAVRMINQPIFASKLDGYCHELYQMYDKKNQMLVLMGSKKSEIERDQQAQLAFIHEELNADNNSCRDFLEEQMQDFFGN